jgi:hypothetical protein
VWLSTEEEGMMYQELPPTFPSELPIIYAIALIGIIVAFVARLLWMGIGVVKHDRRLENTCGYPKCENPRSKRIGQLGFRVTYCEDHFREFLQKTIDEAPPEHRPLMASHILKLYEIELEVL